MVVQHRLPALLLLSAHQLLQCTHHHHPHLAAADTVVVAVDAEAAEAVRYISFNFIENSGY